MKRLLSLGVLCLAGCFSGDQDEPEVLATFAGGQITRTDLDRAILAYPLEQRRPEDGNFQAWYEQLIREIAVNRILTAEAHAKSLERDPGFKPQKDELLRQTLAQLYVQQNAVLPEPPTTEEVANYFQEHRDRFQMKARRRVYHLFKRQPPDVDAAALMAEVQDYRRRVLAGESFSQLAATHSDSEARHREGLLGWFEPGQLSADLDRIVFSLQEGVPSEPIQNRDGVHLFLVETAFESKRFVLEDVRGNIHRQIWQDRYRRMLWALVDSELPQDAFCPDREQLQALLSQGDPEAFIFRAGEYRVDLATFQNRLLHADLRQKNRDPEAAWILLESLKWRELIYRQALTENLQNQPGFADHFQRLEERQLAAVYLEKQLLARIDEDPDKLHPYFENNRKRYQTPPRIKLRRLMVPLDEQATQHMARMESFVQGREPGRGLTTFAAAVAGQIQELPWYGFPELAQNYPEMAPFAAELEIGEVSPPFRTRQHLEMVEALQTEKPQPLPFEQVRQKVKKDYLRHFGQELYAAFTASLLAEHDFHIRRERLQKLAHTEP